MGYNPPANEQTDCKFLDRIDITRGEIVLKKLKCIYQQARKAWRCDSNFQSE